MEKGGNERGNILGRALVYCLGLVDLTLQPVEPSLPFERRNRNLDGGQLFQAERSVAPRAARRCLSKLLKPLRREKVEAQELVGGRIRIGKAGEKAMRAHAAIVRLPRDRDRPFPCKDNVEKQVSVPNPKELLRADFHSLQRRFVKRASSERPNPEFGIASVRLHVDRAADERSDLGHGAVGCTLDDALERLEQQRP